MSYRPVQRDIPVELLTEAGWIVGKLRIPAARRLVDFLNQGKQMLNLTDVYVPERDVRLPFFAVRACACLAVLPETVEPAEAGPSDVIQTAEHRVVMMLGPSSVQGRIRVAAGLRLSDWFIRQHGFIAVQDAVFKLRTHLAQEGVVTEFHEMLVQADKVVGITELDAPLFETPE